MFIELTDHLRCTADHDEQFLVLLPEMMEGRRVTRGNLGCPVCGRVVPIVEGVADFGGDTPAVGTTVLTAEAIASLIGLEGPGGYLALAGAAGSLAPALATLLPGIRFALVNPPADVADSTEASVLRAHRSPLKARSMRGVVVAGDHAGRGDWLAGLIDAVLPGNRIVAEGAPPEREGLTTLAEGAGVWVGRVAGPPPNVRRSPGA